MASRRAVTEGTIVWNVEGQDAIEDAGQAAAKSVRDAGAAAKGTSSDFDGWFDKILKLNRSLDEGLNDNVQDLFLVTDRLHSVVGAATGAIELLSLAGEGLSWVYKELTKESAEAWFKTRELNEAMERQETQAKETAAAMRSLASATAQHELDQSIEQSLRYKRALDEQTDAEDDLARATGKRAAFEQQSLSRSTIFVKVQEAQATALQKAQAEVDKMTLQWNRLDKESRPILTRELNAAVQRRDALLAEREALDNAVVAARERLSAAQLVTGAIVDQAKNVQQLGDGYNELALKESEAEKAAKGASAAARDSGGSILFLADVYRTAAGEARLYVDQVVELVRQIQATRRLADEAAQADYDAVMDSIAAGAERATQSTADLIATLEDIDPAFRDVQERTRALQAQFDATFSAIGEGAAAALVDVVVFGESAAKSVNKLANAVLKEAAIGAAIEGAKAIAQLALFNFAGAAMHAKAAAAYGVAAVVAGGVAAATGGVGGGGGSASAAPPAPPPDFSRRDDRGDQPPGETKIFVNYIARDGPQTRRDLRRWGQTTRRAVSGRAA